MIRMTRAALMRLAPAAVAAALALPAAAQDVTLRLHHFLPIQANLPSKILEPWAERVEAASEGRIKIDRFYGMALGGRPPELIDQTIDGVVDITFTVIGYTPGRFPSQEVFELPFMMTDAESTSRALWELAENRLMDTEFSDLKVLALWVHGPGVIHSKKPVASLEDLQGLKLRAPTRATNMLFETLGATAIGMPVPAIPESISKGVIEAAVIPWEVVPALKVSELVSNHTEFGEDALYTTTFILAMNKGSYDRLPDDLKAVIDAESGMEMSALGGKYMQDYDAPGRAQAEANGNSILTLSPEEVAKWRGASAAVTDRWVSEMDEKGLDGSGLLEEAKALIAKHSN